MKPLDNTSSTSGPMNRSRDDMVGEVAQQTRPRLKVVSVQRNTDHSHLMQIPAEVHQKIAENFNLRDFSRMAGVSKYWNTALANVSVSDNSARRMNREGTIQKIFEKICSKQTPGDCLFSKLQTIPLPTIDANAVKLGGRLKEVQIFFNEYHDTKMKVLLDLVRQPHVDCLHLVFTCNSFNAGLVLNFANLYRTQTGRTLEIKLSLQDFDELNPHNYAALASALPQFSNLKITEISLQSGQWLALSSLMPDLKKIDILLDGHRSGISHRELANYFEILVASRGNRSSSTEFPTLCIQNWTAVEDKHPKFFKHLDALNVKHVELIAGVHDMQLEEWAGLELESLKLTLMSSESDMDGLARILGNKFLQKLVVRELQFPDSPEDIYAETLGEALGKNSGLKHLDLGITIPAKELDLLFRGVIHCASHGTLNYVKIPYPREYAEAGVVSALEKNCPYLKIEHYNQYKGDCDSLLESIHGLFGE